MKFEQRKTRARTEVKSFLSSFSAPRGLDTEAMASHILNIADAFARKLPVTDEAQFAENIEKTFTKIRDNHKGYAWPVQSEFVDAMPKGFVAAPKLETFKADAVEATARRMRAGEKVAESWIWGKSAFSLVSGGQVDRATMDNYRHGSVRQYQDAYKSDAYGIMQAKFGDMVGPYFQNRSSVGGAA